MSEVQRFWCHEASNIRCVRESDYDALAQQLAASEAKCQRLLNGVEEDLAEVDRIQAEYTKQWRKSRERRIQLAARDKQLADAVGLLRSLLKQCQESGMDYTAEAGNARAFLTTIEQDKENDQ